jgi:glycosyltransferase involved in cell wall biosynthesis
MKITLIGTFPPMKALSPYCFHLAEALSKKISLEFISLKNSLPDSLYTGGMIEKTNKVYNIENVQIKPIINWWNPFSWIKAGLAVKGDIIHIQNWALYTNLSYCFIFPIAKIRGKKRIVTIHNITPHTNDFLTKFIDKLLNKIIFSFTDIYITHNQRNKEKLLKIYKLDEKKIFITTHGTVFPYQKLKGFSKQESRKFLNIDNEKKVILFFGYIWTYKGLDNVLKILNEINKKIKNVVLLIAGQPLKDWSKYEKIIKENNLEDLIIKKLNYIPDTEVEYYFSCADFVLLPYNQSPFDTHGGVGALALAFGKPMIVTDVGGLPEYTKDKRFVAHPNDLKDLTIKIINVLDDEKLLDKLSKDSIELSSELSWDKIADKTIEIYKKII